LARLKSEEIYAWKFAHFYKYTPLNHESEESCQEQIYILLTGKPGSNKERQDFGKT
jgi:hypothetical protein